MEPITLFYFTERVARLREAQRIYDDVSSSYNHRQMVPLMHEIDSLLIRIQSIRLYPEFLRFVQQVEEMRNSQGAFGLVADVDRLNLEMAVDKSVDRITTEAKFLNEQLRAHNIALEVPATKPIAKGGQNE